MRVDPDGTTDHGEPKCAIPGRETIARTIALVSPKPEPTFDRRSGLLGMVEAVRMLVTEGHDLAAAELASTIARTLRMMSNPPRRGATGRTASRSAPA